MSKGKLNNTKRRAQQHEEESKAVQRGEHSDVKRPNNAKRDNRTTQGGEPSSARGELSRAKKRPKQHEEESRAV
jgi:hypothetical protein